MSIYTEGKNILFTVAMSVYDGVNLAQLERSVYSILFQSYTNFEFFIYQDGLTKPDLKNFLSNLNDPRVILVGDSENKGLAIAMNFVFKRFSGDYFVRMDADDVSSLNRLKDVEEYILHNPEVDVFGSFCFQGPLGDMSLDQCHEARFDLIKYPVSHSAILDMFLIRNPLAHPTMVAKRRVCKEFYYPIYSLRNEDTLFWLSLIKAGYIFANIDKPLYYLDFDDSAIFRRSGISKSYSDLLDRLRVIFDLEGSLKHVVIAFCAAFITMTPFYKRVRSYVVRN